MEREGKAAGGWAAVAHHCVMLCVRVAFAKFGLSVLYSYRSTYGELCTEGYEGKIFPFL